MHHPLARRRFAAPLAFVLSMALAACGGGGGDGNSEPAVQVTLSQTSASATYPSRTNALNAPGTTVTATVANPPSTPVYVVVTDSGHGLRQGASTAFANGDGTYTATLRYDLSLAPGSYTGTAQLKLCKDSACASAYPVTGGALSYTVVVTPTATFAVTVNGVAKSFTQANTGEVSPALGLEVKDGDVVSVTASQPMDWSTSQGGAIIESGSQTTTTWTAKIGYGLSTPGGTGLLDLQATYLPDTPSEQYSNRISIAVTQ